MLEPLQRPSIFPVASGILALVLASSACTGTNTSEDHSCVDAKCDTPGTTDPDVALEQCEARRADALDGSQQAFTQGAIRWPAADVEGVNTNGGDDRGQEYTEYFAIVDVPPESGEGDAVESRILGKNTGSSFKDSFSGETLGVGEHRLSVEEWQALQPVTLTTDLGLELNTDQIFWLEDRIDDTVGTCVFTSWHADVAGPLCSRATGCEDVRGFGLGDDHRVVSARPQQSGSEILVQVTERVAPLFRMVVGFNSNTAASSLVADCAVAPETLFDKDDLQDDSFVRGCMLTGPQGAPGSVTGFGTQWRRSDSAICVAAMRLVECGCGIDANMDGVLDPDEIPDPRTLGESLIPPQPADDGSVSLRGFPLGTWSGFEAGNLESDLPAGCRYGDTGDSSQTVVLCDLSGNDVLANQADPKGACRDKYGQNVVTHIPVPHEAILCEPTGDLEYGGASCQSSADPLVLLKGGGPASAE